MNRNKSFIQSLARVSHLGDEPSPPGKKRGLVGYFLFIAFCGMLSSNAWGFNSIDHSSGNFRIRAHQKVIQQVLPADIEAEIRFGKKVAARILGREHLFDNEHLTHYINLIGKTLVFHSNRNDLEYHFALLDSDLVNAYSTPGGYIFITKGAIEFAQDEAELAGILAHEIAHISQRHIVNELNIHGEEKTSLSGLAQLVGASATTSRVALAQTVDKAITLLFKTGYKTVEELEADRIATLILAETGYDPTALNRYLHRVHEKQDLTRLSAKTHPPSAKRFNKLDELISSEGLSSPSFKTGRNRFNSYIQRGS